MRSRPCHGHRRGWLGRITRRPGMWAYHPSRLCECCAASCQPAPVVLRMTTPLTDRWARSFGLASPASQESRGPTETPTSYGLFVAVPARHDVSQVSPFSRVSAYISRSGPVIKSGTRWLSPIGMAPRLEDSAPGERSLRSSHGMHDGRLPTPGIVGRQIRRKCNVGNRMTVKGDIRPRGAIEAMYGEAMAIRCAMSRNGHDDIGLREIDGILATVTWALGRSLSAPVSERHPAEPEDLSTEERLVIAELRQMAASDQCRRSYLTAVRETLRWLTGETENLPL